MTVEIRRSGDVAIVTEPRYRVDAVESEFSVSVSSAIVVITGDPYAGPYTVTPTNEEQVLATYHKTMTGNLTINPIPSNYGLITWNGSTLTVS